MTDEIVPLQDVGEEPRFGGKAASLARALKHGLPAPPGFALSAAAVRALDEGNRATLHALRAAYRSLGGLVAVRSSAIGEDSGDASFAGQHLTKLGVLGETTLLAAIFAVNQSGHAEGAQHYRRLRAGAGGEIAVAIVVQRLLDPRAAGVLFTRDPVTGADCRVAEGAPGLGEAVVSSLVTPDFVRFARGGAILDTRAGHKPLSLHPLPGGGVEKRETRAAEADALCLSPGDVEALDGLATQCETHYGGPQDIEWAFAEGGLYLLQSRPITVAGAR